MTLYERLKNLDAFEIGLLLYNVFLIIQVWLGNINFLTVGMLLWFEMILAGFSEIILGFIHKTSQKFALFFKLFSFLFFMIVIYSMIDGNLRDLASYSVYEFILAQWIYLVIMIGLFIVRLFLKAQSKKDVFEYVLVKIFLFIVLFLLSIVIIGSSNVFSVNILSQAVLTCIIVTKLVVDFFLYSKD